MSDKATCPSCQAHLSSVYRAFEQDASPCPNCGLPYEVYWQVVEARLKYLDDERTDQLTDAIAARGKAEAERDDYLRELRDIHDQVKSLAEKIAAQMRPLDVKTRDRGEW